MPLGKALADCSEAMLMIRPQPFCAHGRLQGLSEEKGHSEIDVEGVPPASWCHRFGRLAPVYAGGIDEDIRRTQGGRDRLRHPRHSLRVGEIGGMDGGVAATLLDAPPPIGEVRIRGARHQ